MRLCVGPLVIIISGAAIVVVTRQNGELGGSGGRALKNTGRPALSEESRNDPVRGLLVLGVENGTLELALVVVKLIPAPEGCPLALSDPSSVPFSDAVPTQKSFSPIVASILSWSSLLEICKISLWTRLNLALLLLDQ